MTKLVRLDHLLGVYSVGSGEWSWSEEYDKLVHLPRTDMIATSVQEVGFEEPVLLGSDGRVWDGHHRIVVAMLLGITYVPVTFSGEFAEEKLRSDAAWREFQDRQGGA